MKMFDALQGLRKRIVDPGIPKGSHRATVIAVSAQKGGVGKTTTTVHLGVGLAMHHNYKVLLLDMDPQGHVGMSLRNIMAGAARGDAAHVPLGELLLQRRRDVFEGARETKIPNLWVVPSDCNLNETEALMSGRIGKELLLRKAIQVARTHFDIILIDCPPTLGALTINALVAADQVLVPCDLNMLSLDGVEALLETLEDIRETLNPNASLLGLLRTRVDRRNVKLNETIERSLEQRYAPWLFESVIGVSTDLPNAQLDGEPVFISHPKGRASRFYQDLSAEVARNLGPAWKKSS